MAGWFGLSDGCKLTFSMWVPPDQSNQSRSPSITSRGPSSVFPPGFSASQTPGPAARLRESSNVLISGTVLFALRLVRAGRLPTIEAQLQFGHVESR